MDINKILIVPKITSLDYTMTQFNLTKGEVIDKWKGEGMSEEDIRRTIGAHDNHHNSLGIFKRVFHESQFIPRDEFNRDYADSAQAVISIGGDDHLQYVSHFITNTPLIGVNSDPIKRNGASDGSLMNLDANDASTLVSRLNEDNFQVEFWTRLVATISNGREVTSITPATCQYSLITEDPEDMARVLVEFKGESELQRGSGFLIATGAGTTGWYKGAYKYISSHKYRIPRTQRTAKFVLREPFEKEDPKLEEITTYKMPSLTLHQGDEIIMTYFTHNEGRLSSDTQKRYRIARGNKVSIRISDMPLNVVNLAR